MLSDIDDDPPISHAIADGWANFVKTVLPSIGGNELAQAHIAFHFGAMYVLQIAQEVIADRSGDEVSLALGMLDAELEQFMKSHAIAIQWDERAQRPPTSVAPTINTSSISSS
jgi:hypothetical protein